MDGTVRRAELTGTDRVPLVRLWFNRHDTLKGGRRLLDAVRALPRAQFDGEAQCWVVSATGRDPDRLLQRWGFEIDLEAEDPSLAGVQSLGEVFDPLLRLSAKQPGVVLVRPRLAGFARTLELLGPGARWDKATQRFEVPVADLVDDDGEPLPGLVYGRGIVQEARRRLAEPKPPREAAVLASVTSMGDAPGAAAALVDAVGDVPDWFGLDLYGYQRTGAIAAAAGLAQLGDAPGLGKTRQALAAASIRGVERLLVVSPPVMLSGWEREATLSRVAGVGGRLPGAEVVVITPRRKEPDLPRRGVVIVSDSLLASREALAKRIRLWAPDGLIVDEVHRLKTWDSARGRVVRAVAEAVGDGPRLAISGTPLFANPVELANTLAITGQLDPVFGGMGRFCAAFARQNKYKAWVARKRELPRLRSMLDQYVWVRRHKEDVLTDLPAKSRREMIVDVDLSGFRAAHREVTEVVEGWVEEFLSTHGRFPEAADIAEYARDSIGLTSQLRKAAGLAKVDAATEYIVDWVASNETTLDEQGRTVYDRPLVVWTHHRVVSTAMAEAVPDAVGGARVIMGGISKAEQASIVDDFQAGLVPVLVASITAAGVGITLTRSSDALFVETDWTPALVLQAEDRCVLEGQPVMTLDGPVPIEDVEVGAFVLTHEGTWRRVTDKWSRTANTGVTKGSGKRHMRALTTVRCQSNIELTVTHDHLVLAKRADTGDVDWVPASSLLPGDALATPRLADTEPLDTIAISGRHRRWTREQIAASRRCRECGAESIARNLCSSHYRRWAYGFKRKGLPLPPAEGRAPNGRYRPLPDELTVDDGLLRLCGWYVAEGFSSVRGGKGSFVSLSAHEDERPVLEGHADYLKRRFGVHSTIMASKGRGIELRAYSFELASWFLEQFGHGARNKSLPGWVFKLSRSQAKVFLESYWAGDGHVRPTRAGTSLEQSWVTASPVLSRQIELLAAAQAHRVSTTVHAASGPGWVSSFTPVADEPDELYVWRTVRSVSTESMRPGQRVWDLTVEGAESFVVDRVVVHNCHRVSQTRPVTLTTMVAPGTLDEQVQKVLAAKAKVLEPLLGEGQDVSVIDTDDEDELTAPAEIVFDIADRLVAKRRRSRLSRAA